MGGNFYIDWYDDDFLETHFHDKPQNSLSKLLKGHSYLDYYLPLLIEKHTDALSKEYNTIIALYQVAYDGTVKYINNPEYGSFDFLNTVRFEKDNPWLYGFSQTIENFIH